MTNEQLAELMEKYRKGTCTPEEAAILNQWYASYQNKPDMLNTLSAAEREQIQLRMYKKISSRITITNESKTRKRIIPLWLKVGVAAALTGFVLLFVWNRQTANHNTTAIVSENWANISNNGKNIIKQDLPDGSSVWLKPGSRLSYPKAFAKASRNVKMQGEAFFEVAKNPQCPFIIESKHIITKVWGTSFSVLDNYNMQKATVTVLTGKVSVSKTGSEAHLAGAKLLASEVVLHPKQQVVYSEADNSFFANRNADMGTMNLWKHIDLSFKNEKLTGIALVLNQKFGVQIKIEGEKLKNSSMTADLTGLNLPEVLEVLKTSMNINYEIAEDDLIILKTTN
ncbi:FecR family protein [Mucilaginibacter terrae]|uniref:Transmembrane sensor n=1 Tax=Mucilaginibacter terrae TaxID=1955052 RepID=A0ABU3GPA9_9SPHI|nr:FecR family protein [Mucilaginibacter terrae]MDT3401618.1 transmembrane sensor [Mucilaginibacter terrae]